MHAVPLLDSVHTHRETQCVALCVVPPLTGTTHIRGLLVFIYFTMLSIPLVDTEHSEINMVCYHSPVWYVGYPLIR